MVLLGFSYGGGIAALALGSAYVVAGAVWLTAEHWLEMTLSPMAGGSSRLPLAPVVLISGSLLAVVALALLFYPAQRRSLPETIAAWLDARTLVPASASANAFRNQSTLERLANQKYGQAQAGPADAQGPLAHSGAKEGPWEKGGRQGPSAAHAFSVVRQPGSARPAATAGRVLFEMENDLLRHVPMLTYSDFDGLQWRADVGQNPLRLAVEINDPLLWVARLDPLPFALDEPGGQAFDSAANNLQSGDALDAARLAAARWLDGAASIEPRMSPADLRSLTELLKRPPGHTLDVPWMLTPYDLGFSLEHLRHNAELARAVRRLLDSPAGQRIFRDLVESRIRRRQLAVPPGIRALLETWTAGRAPGWPQIRAVVDGLRTQCIYDPRATIPPEAQDPLSHFLLQSRRGPDYLFASSAAVLLRSLGYPSRLVSGFYANPARRGWLSGRVAVRGDDLHYWTQTRLANGMWADLEPTPGYELPGKEVLRGPWLANVREKLLAAGREHRVLIVAACVAGLALAVSRRRLSNLCRTLLWKLRLRRGGVPAVLATWRLLEWRARATGHVRPRGKTLAQWYPRLFSAAAGGTSQQLRTLANWADRAAFRPGGLAADAAAPREEITRLCREVARACGLTTFCRLQRGVAGRAVPEPVPRSIRKPPSAPAARPLRPPWMAVRLAPESVAANRVDLARHLSLGKHTHEHDATSDRAPIGPAG